MSTKFLSAVKQWNDTYGTLGAWLWRIVLYPVLALCMYSGTAYLESHYVSKSYFDQAVISISEDKDRFSLKQEAALREISVKLDALIISSAANGQKFIDTERRLSRLEDKMDKTQK